MKQILSLVAFFLVTLVAFGQDAVTSNQQVVMTLNDKPISLKAFEAVFKKNNDNPDTSPEGLDEYMELFVKYKLKVAEAEALGMDTLESFKRELNGYRRTLAAPYLTDENAEESLVKQAYDNLMFEVDASHILIRVQGQLPKDTLEPYQRILKIKEEIKNGADFGTVAAQKSEDPSAKNNKGALGYFSGLQMVWPFEKAAFDAEVGDVVGPVRTNFGYHLIQVNDKRKSRGTVRVAHILIKEDKIETVAKTKAEELYNRVKAGESFADLANKYSEDKGTANKGGELPSFGSGKMVPEFEEAAFALENEGDISKPVKTQFGYHIIKLLEKLPVASFEEMEAKIVKRIKRDDRSRIAQESFINKLKKEYNFKRNDQRLADFYKWVTPDVFEGTWRVPEKAGDNYIAAWADTGITQKAFAIYLNSLQRKAPKEEIKSFIDRLYEPYEKRKFLEYEDSRLEDKHPAFAALMQEYRDGILLFDLMNKKVWNKAIEDTTGLKEFFAKNQNDFQWKERADVTIYKSEDKKLLNKVAKKLAKGADEASLLGEFAGADQLQLTSSNLLEERGENETLTNFDWKEGVSSIKKVNDRYTLVHFKELIPSGNKNLDEARGAAIAAYQNYLEAEWIKSLKDKYDIRINKKVLYSLK